MGFRQGAVLFATCFFLGVQFVNFNTDYRLLFAPLTDATFDDAFGYYTTFFTAPIGVRALLHSMIGVGLIGFIGKMHKWDESAVFFDGTSLALFMGAFIVYMSVVLPGLRTVANPLPEDTLDVRQEAVRVLAAGNTLIVLALVGVLALQAGQEWARQTDAAAVAAVDAADKKAHETTKKTQ